MNARSRPFGDSNHVVCELVGDSRFISSSTRRRYVLEVSHTVYSSLLLGCYLLFPFFVLFLRKGAIITTRPTDLALSTPRTGGNLPRLITA